MTHVWGTLLALQALLERDIRAVLRSRSQLYSSLLLPLAVLAILGGGVSGGLNPDSSLIRGGDYTSFLVPGVITMTAVFSSTFSSASYYRDKDSGLLRVLLASPHRGWVILVGRSLAGILIGTAQALLVLLIAAVIPSVDLGWQQGIGLGIVFAFIAILLLNLLLAGVAQFLSTRIGTMAGFHLVMNLVLFPLFFLSGAFFPLADVPAWLQVLGRLNPLSYAVDFLHIVVYADSRDGYYGLGQDIPVLVGVATILLFWSARHRPSTY